MVLPFWCRLTQVVLEKSIKRIVVVGNVRIVPGDQHPSIRRPMVDEEKTRSGHWLRVSAFSFLQCFDTVG